MSVDSKNERQMNDHVAALIRAIRGQSDDAKMNRQGHWTIEVELYLRSAMMACDKIEEMAGEIEQLRASTLLEIKKSLLERMARASCNCSQNYGCQLAKRILDELAKPTTNKECEG